MVRVHGPVPRIRILRTLIQPRAGENEIREKPRAPGISVRTGETAGLTPLSADHVAAQLVEKTQSGPAYRWPDTSFLQQKFPED